MSSKSSEEVAKDYVEFFGAEDGAVVHRLTDGVS